MRGSRRSPSVAPQASAHGVAEPEEPVRYEMDGPVAWITIDRPDAANTLSEAVRSGLWAGLRRFAADGDARVAVLTGAGEKAFCAGGDLKEMEATGLTTPPPDFMPHLNRNIDVDKPVIAAVNGVALGGGFLLAQMADLCVAVRGASFGITEARWGRGFPWASPLSWLVPPRIALELMYTATPITAERAYEIGLVNHVVDPDDLRSHTQQLAETIAANAPLTVAAAKKMVYGAAADLYRAQFDRAEEIFEPVYESDDAQEGPRAFRERRQPRWTGR